MWRKIMEKISKHISYKEGVYSTTALRRNIANNPNEEQLSNMKLIAEKIFEPLRAWVGGPIKINSFFRGADHNTVKVRLWILMILLDTKQTQKCIII
jgi:hypothetical protein